MKLLARPPTPPRPLSDAGFVHDIFRTIVETTPECVKVVGRDGTVLRVNAAGLAMAGARSEDELVGRNFFDFVAPEDLERYRSFHEQVCNGQKGFLEFEIVGMRGERRQMETHAAPMRNHDGAIVQLGVTRDITARKQAEETLRRTAAMLVEAQRLSMTGSWAWRVSTDGVTWSDEVYRIFGFEVGTRVTLGSIAGRVHPEDMPMIHDMVTRARNGVEDFEYALRLLMPDGAVKHLHMTAHGRRDANGVWEYIGALQDVTERRLAEDALSHARSKLASVARVTSLGVLTASIAHEVSQPLAGILTNASTCLRMLAAEPPNLEGARETARRTIRDGQRASDVIVRLHALFANKRTVVQAVDLNDAVREVIALSLSELQANRVVLLLELVDDLPPVTGDRIQLQQVILNLVRNASEAMSGIDDRPRQLTIKTELEEGGSVRLTVRDCGVGFEQGAVDKLFDSFYSTKSSGMGIGLSVSSSIIERHEGRMWAAPNAGPGATFAFSVPCRAEPQQDANLDGFQPRLSRPA